MLSRAILVLSSLLTATSLCAQEAPASRLE